MIFNNLKIIGKFQNIFYKLILLKYVYFEIQ
jgi:hypothetical protein